MTILTNLLYETRDTPRSQPFPGRIILDTVEAIGTRLCSSVARLLTEALVNSPGIVSARVIAGRGKAGVLVQSYHSALKELLGSPIYPGSLNLCLTAPVWLNPDRAKTFANNRMLWPAKLCDTSIWVYRWPTAPLHVAEVFARERLRDTLMLTDGDLVNIQFEPQDVLPTPFWSQAFYQLLWSRRGEWYYTNDTYTEVAQWLDPLRASYQGLPKGRDTA